MNNYAFPIKKDRFDKLWDLLRSSGFSANVHPEESKIRLEQPIVNGKSQYIFRLNRSAAQGTDGVVTFALDQQDVFVPNSWGLFIGIKNNATGVEKLYSFAPKCPTGVPSVFEAGFTDDQIDALYSGFMQWLVDNTVQMSAYPLEKFQKIPRQQGAFVLDSNDTPVSEQIMTEHNLDAMTELILPRYTVAGTRDHRLSVNFPAAGLTFGVTSGYTANLVLFIDGFLVKGGCEYKGGSGTNPFGDAVGQW